ncbi:MAG: 2-oxo acid dehydrogenase subunit E2 [Nanoarchaeota archaeon]
METNTKNYSVSKPLASICIQIDADKVDSLIKKIKNEENFNLNVGEIVIFSIVKALKDFPMFNSIYDQNLILYDSINLGHFVNLGSGPKLAVIKDADTRNLYQIAQEIKESALRYIRGELLAEDTALSTISVTNLYSFEAFQVTPPVYEHQSAMFSITSKFVSWDEGIVRKFNLTLSYDARVADCQTAIAFLNNIKNRLEAKAL